MIEFQSITWKNFLSTGNSPNKVQLNRSASTLIVGKNGDGKSTILDALCFSLFGKPFRNINKPQLINSINQKNCLVEIEFKIGKKQYKIVRGIKPNLFEIYLDGEMINQDAASKDYQKVLEQQILKLNYKTFTQVVILGSASFVPFMQLPSAQRREVIEDILDIKIFSTMNQLLKEKIQETKDEITRVEYSIETATQRVDNQQKIIKTITDARTENLEAIQAKISANEVEIVSINETIASITSDIETLKSSIEDSEKLAEDLEKAKKLLAKKNNRLGDIQKTLEFFEGNDSCPSCAQGIPHEHKSSMVEKLKGDFESNQTMVSQISTAFERIKQRLSDIQLINTSITAKTLEISGHNSTIMTLMKVNQQLEKEKQETNADDTNLTEEKKKLKEYAKEALALSEHKAQLKETYQYETAASGLLKDTGIKTSIIREYLPAMNKLINKYLSAMDFFVHFELDETFTEKIKSRFRDEFTYASFSEGEKMRIDLAILFTWRQIAKMKNSVNTNLLVLDEIFDSSLDVAGTDYFLSVMNTLGEKTNVFVISHKGDQLFDKFHSVIKFEKKNDFSVMVGA